MSALLNRSSLHIVLVFLPLLSASVAEALVQDPAGNPENEHVSLIQDRSFLKRGPREVLRESSTGTSDALLFSQMAVEVSSAQTVEEVPADGVEPAWPPSVEVDEPAQDGDMTCSREGLTPGVCAMKTLAHAEAATNVSSELDFVNPERLERALFQEIEAALKGTHNGFSPDHLREVEKELGALFAALPKNEAGLLDHAAVRYAVHQHFLRKHAWYIRSLNPVGEAQAPVSASEALRGQVPEHLQRLIEKRQGGRGLGLRELSALAATLDHLIDGDLAERLKAVYVTHGLEYSQPASRSDVSEVLKTYMAHLISLKHRSGYAVSAEQSREEVRFLESAFTGWPSVRVDIEEAMSSRAPAGPGVMLPFSAAVSAANEVMAKFQQSMAQECRDIKQDLSAMPNGATGRVLLTDLRLKFRDGNARYRESTEYLGLLGALDKNQQGSPSVLVPNYVYSPSNCLGTTSFLDMCCPNECEMIMAQLEARLRMPEVSPDGVKEVINSLRAEGPLSGAAMEDLEALAHKRDGHVPLHGYLFSQWLHHVFPTECPRPRMTDFAAATQDAAEAAEVPAGESEFQAVAQLQYVSSSDSDLMREAELAEQQEDQVEEELREVMEPEDQDEELQEVMEPPANASEIIDSKGSGLRAAKLKTIAAEKLVQGGLQIPSAFDTASLAQTRLDVSGAVSSTKGEQADKK